MHKQKRLQYAVVGVLGFALLFMSVGFVAYAQLVSGNSAFALRRVEDVHNIGFNAESYDESDTSVAAIEKIITADELEFAIRLEKPGDSYAAKINVVNNGNVDEVLSEIDMNGLDESLADYVDYVIEYEDEDYIGTSYDVNSLIEPGKNNRKQMFVSARYKADAQNIGPLDLRLSTGLVFDE
jgi:hypothetical protein